MAEVQNPPKKVAAGREKKPARGKGAGKEQRSGPVELRRKSERSARTATAKAPASARAKEGKQSRRGAGRLRAPRAEATYRRADTERVRQVRANIESALQAAHRIREEIEAKIERRLHEEHEGRKAGPGPARSRPEPTGAGQKSAGAGQKPARPR